MALVSNKSPLNKKKTHFPQTNIEKKTCPKHYFNEIKLVTGHKSTPKDIANCWLVILYSILYKYTLHDIEYIYTQNVFI
jgi:hypothetical protein